MAIKIIKQGKKEYYMICNKCGCEFTYELEDINYNSSVKCPCCSQSLYHNGYNLTITNPYSLEAIPCVNEITGVDSTNPCASCDWFKKMKTGITYVGDTPCTWCEHGSIANRSSTTGTTSVDHEEKIFGGILK